MTYTEPIWLLSQNQRAEKNKSQHQSKHEIAEEFCQKTWGLSLIDVFYRNAVSQYVSGYMTFQTAKGGIRYKRYQEYKHIINDSNLMQHYLNLAEESGTVFPTEQE